MLNEADVRYQFTDHVISKEPGDHVKPFHSFTRVPTGRPQEEKMIRNLIPTNPHIERRIYVLMANGKRKFPCGLSVTPCDSLPSRYD